MNKETILIPVDVALYVLNKGNNQYKLISDKILSSNRQTQVDHCEVVFQRVSDGKYFKSEYYVSDFCAPWDDLKEVQFSEVFKKEVTTTIYE